MFQIASQLANYVADSFSSPWTVDISFNDASQRQTAKVNYDGTEKECYIFVNTGDMNGEISLNIKEGRLLEHDGILLELVGRTETRESPDYQYLDTSAFLRLSRELAPPGKLAPGEHKLEFCFDSLELPKESYYGGHAYLRYFLRVTLTRAFGGNFVHEEDFIVQIVSTTWPPFEQNPPINMEVGVQDCLHIQFLYSHSHYTLDGVLTGCVMFKIVRLNILSMEMSLVRVESVQASNPVDGKTTFLTTVGKMEFMDGSPARAEQVPIRWPLAGIPLTVSCSHQKFTVHYVLKLALVDERGRQFFKQCKIHFHRHKIGAPELSWSMAKGNNNTWKDFNDRQPKGSPSLFS